MPEGNKCAIETAVSKMDVHWTNWMCIGLSGVIWNSVRNNNTDLAGLK